jgi:ADP-heptose:LPS heptosyltransferase
MIPRDHAMPDQFPSTWAAAASSAVALKIASTPRKLILKNSLSPGDVCTLTAAVESLHRTYPGEYLTDVRTSTPAIWEHNPWITRIDDADPDAFAIDTQYPTIHRSNQEGHRFLAGYTEHLGSVIQRPLSLRTNRPCLYLSDEERRWTPQVDPPFWLMVGGLKQDFTAKSWPLEHYQAVIDSTASRVRWVLIGSQEHDHPPLRGVIDLRGRTTHRQLIRLVYHAAGGLGPVTYLQHLCAAWERPYVCLVGGREPATWVQYPLQQTLHTIGGMDCCRTAACWRSRVVPLPDGDAKNNSLCSHPVVKLLRPAPECMVRIGPGAVIDCLRRIGAF